MKKPMVSSPDLSLVARTKSVYYRCHKDALETQNLVDRENWP